MEKNSDFVAYLLDLLKPLSGTSARRMFGGVGIYKEKLMFALVVNDELFLKADESNRNLYEERGLAPFTYNRKGKEVSLSYYQAPAECLDESRILCDWAEQSIQAARRKNSNRS